MLTVIEVGYAVLQHYNRERGFRPTFAPRRRALRADKSHRHPIEVGSLNRKGPVITAPGLPNDMARFGAYAR